MARSSPTPKCNIESMQIRLEWLFDAHSYEARKEGLDQDEYQEKKRREILLADIYPIRSLFAPMLICNDDSSNKM